MGAEDARSGVSIGVPTLEQTAVPDAGEVFAYVDTNGGIRPANIPVVLFGPLSSPISPQLPESVPEPIPERTRDVIGNFGRRLGYTHVTQARVENSPLIDIELGDDIHVFYNPTIPRYRWSLSPDPKVPAPRRRIEQVVRRIRRENKNSARFLPVNIRH